MASSVVNKPTILITGANGQLGSELRSLSTKYPSFSFLFKTRSELAIEDKSAVNDFLKTQPVNYCINCAAYTAVDKAETEKEKAFLINAEAPGMLASLCNDYAIKFIHISTDYVYDGSIQQPLKENNAVAPLNVYGLSKLRGEELVVKNNPSSIIIRTSWVYSSFGNNFVKTMLRLFREKESLNVINDQQGSPTYAADLAQVIMDFISNAENGNQYSGTVNYCNSGITTWFDFALAIKDFVKSTCEIYPVPTSQYPTPATRPQYSVLDTSGIRAILHQDIPSWKDSLHKCLEILTESN